MGARIYYVIFSWDQFRDDFLSVFRIWEGGIAIYGAVIAGFTAAAVFSVRRKISVWTLCDLAAPGLVLAQAIGRWGNYFNQEAYGLALKKASLCFFPFAVQIQGTAGPEWHMATFFYESCWNLCVFVFLMTARSCATLSHIAYDDDGIVGKNLADVIDAFQTVGSLVAFKEFHE